ncbi:uncharacterized protein BKA78DRAFT_140137 [Phyllosticta capitalensis]|uniref:uncharacterized protein n=1 Tax=Phyllosticta capitalensis TaxID=121624 RepID=UPI00312E280F
MAGHRFFFSLAIYQTPAAGLGCYYYYYYAFNVFQGAMAGQVYWVQEVQICLRIISRRVKSTLFAFIVVEYLKASANGSRREIFFVLNTQLS